jgi:nucleotide-binding universal stress UspA family protein
VRPGEQALALISEPVLDNILIPLDGSALAEQILEPAADLAQQMEAQCNLLRVIESPPKSGDDGPEVSRDKVQAETYLEHVAAKVREKGVQVRTRVLVARHAVEAILEEAEIQPNSVIALASHGRGGIKRMLLGSVADKLVRSAKSPVFVYRPTGKDF